MEVLKTTKKDLLLEDSLKKKESIMKIHFLQQQGTLPSTIMALASMMKWDLDQMDVKTTFLNGVIEEEVFIKKPQDFDIEGRATHVCKLKKAMYGLK